MQSSTRRKNRKPQRGEMHFVPFTCCFLRIISVSAGTYPEEEDLWLALCCIRLPPPLLSAILSASIIRCTCSQSGRCCCILPPLTSFSTLPADDKGDKKEAERPTLGSILRNAPREASRHLVAAVAAATANLIAAAGERKGRSQKLLSSLTLSVCLCVSLLVFCFCEMKDYGDVLLFDLITSDLGASLSLMALLVLVLSLACNIESCNFALLQRKDLFLGFFHSYDLECY